MGVPQGSVLGPLLFLLFINDLCNLSIHSNISLFADDTCIYFSGNNICDIVNKVQSDINTIYKWFCTNHLSVNADKSFAIVVGSRQKLAHIPTPYPVLTINGTTLRYNSTAEYLGMTIDATLTWNEHVDSVTSKIKPKLGALARLSKILPQPQLHTIYMTTIQPCIDYGLIIWGHHSQFNLNVVQKFQNRAARLVTRNFDYSTPSSQIIASLNWQTVSQRLFYFTNLFMFKCIHGLTPNSFDFLTVRRSEFHNYNTRHSYKLQLPKVRTDLFRKSFSFQGPNLWNSLPDNFYNITDLVQFKNSLKQYSLSLPQ
jgi:hypothetical protein